MFDKNNIDCESEEIIVELDIENSHVKEGNLSGYTWTVPQGWTIQPNQFIGNRSWGHNFPSISINTNNHTTGQFKIKLDYEGPSFCAPKSYTRGVNIRIDACRPEITYNQQPTLYQSHSSELTKFAFQQPTTMSLGVMYRYVSAEAIELKNNFEFTANANTELDLFIEECSCDSEYHDPDRLGETLITLEDIKNKKEGSTIHTSSNNRTSPDDFESSESKAEDFSIYPNPNSGDFSINFRSDTKIIMVSRISGVTVKKKIVNANGNEWSLAMNLQEQSPGMYFVHFYGNNGELLNQQKLVIK
jgi:hypothetical protein